MIVRLVYVEWVVCWCTTTSWLILSWTSHIVFHLLYSLPCYRLGCCLSELSRGLLRTDVFSVHVLVTISFDACATNQDEEDSAEAEPKEHSPAPEPSIADEEHRGYKQIEEALARDRLDEQEIRLDELNLAEGYHQQKAKDSGTKRGTSQEV